MREAGGPAPGAAPRAPAAPRVCPRSLPAAETPAEKRRRRASPGKGSGRRGIPRPPRAAPTSPALASGGARSGASARGPGPPDRPGTELAAGGAALRLRPPPRESGRPRAGRDGTYRARGGGGEERGAPVGSCGAECGSRGWQARRPREARGGGRQGWRRPREARRGWAARRAVCGPGRARGAGERRASGSDVRGVSAPNRERGRGQRREGRAQERAGGALGRSLRGRAPAPRRPGASGRPSVRGDGAAGLRVPPRPAPRLVPQLPPPGFSALGCLPA